MEGKEAETMEAFDFLTTPWDTHDNYGAAERNNPYLLLREAHWDSHWNKLLAQAQIKKKVN